jgi:branched-chain amino acid transport system ATP-binding protein
MGFTVKSKTVSPPPGLRTHKGANMLQVRDISKSFGGNVVLSDVSFDINSGDVVGLIGPNGAGKTTLFNILSGVYRSKTGRIKFHGQSLDRLKPEQICKRGLCRTFQITKPFGNISVTQNVMVGALIRTGSLKKAKQKALEILEFVGLYDKRDTLGRSLTIADRKRLEIARGLATQPRLLLLDEVMAGLNPQELSEVKRLIEDIRHSGITLFIIEHIMGVMMSLSDRIIVLDYGKMLCEGSPDSISCDPDVIKAYLGEEYLAATS